MQCGRNYHITCGVTPNKKWGIMYRMNLCITYHTIVDISFNIFVYFMNKIYKLIVLLIFTSFPFSTNAHVQHYDNLNRIEFDIFRNNKHIGKHIFSFNRENNQLAFES